MANYITTGFLHLRSSPVIPETDRNKNVLGTMPPDTIVREVNGGIPVAGWRQVEVFLGRNLIQGFASAKYLELTQLGFVVPDPAPVQILQPIHYPLHNRIVSKNQTGTWVYPLNEPGLVKTDLKMIADVSQRKSMIQNVISFLDVEHSARYAPNSKSTYCNIYAYDVAYCLGAFLPRVWWTPEALSDVLNGNPPAILYDRTVTEITANRLTDWFENYGEKFEWQRVFDLTILQNEINTGTLGIIVAQRINANRSGHIVAVVPESSSHAATRDHNKVTSPLQSQAGSVNRQYYTGRNWWEDSSRFKKFGCWVWKLN